MSQATGPCSGYAGLRLAGISVAYTVTVGVADVALERRREGCGRRCDCGSCDLLRFRCGCRGWRRRGRSGGLRLRASLFDSGGRTLIHRRGSLDFAAATNAACPEDECRNRPR